MCKTGEDYFSYQIIRNIKVKLKSSGAKIRFINGKLGLFYECKFNTKKV